MTAKRFTVDEGLENVLCWEINDKENEDMTCGECAKLLNELAEENEQLKQAYTQLKHRHSLLHDECIDAECDRDRYRKDISSLEKENEQLKSSDTITDLETEIMNLKAILNDFINILNRLQSNPNDKQTLSVARDMLQNMGKELLE